MVCTVRASASPAVSGAQTVGRLSACSAVCPSRRAATKSVPPGFEARSTIRHPFGSAASSTAVGAALWWITPFTPLQAGLIALVVNIMGFFGGFVLSAIKRDRGVKDWGAMIEGHGGMLDRVDSISFSAPIFFHIVRYWWV